MKQSKRMLSVLLAIIMICSTMTIGASAMKAEITYPAGGYDEVLDPVVSAEQAARMILDLIEPLLADMDDVDLKVMTLKINSIDNILNSLVDLDDSTFADIALGILGGDLNDINLKAGKVKDSKGNYCRRNNTTSTDFEVLGAVLTVLESNADIVCKAAYDGIDFGALETFGVFGEDDLAALKDVHGLVVTLVEKLLAGEEFELEIDQEYHSSNTLDGILQDFIDNRLVKLIVDLLADDGENPAADILGLNAYLAPDGTLTQDIPTTTVFPSLTEGNLGRLNLNQDSFYDFVIKIVKAAVNDIVIPYAGALLGDLIDDDIAGVIDAVVEILELDVDLSVCTTAKEKVDMLLNYLLVDGGIKKFFLFKEATSPSGVAVKYLSFADGFWTTLTDLLKIALPMLPGLLGDDCPNFDKTDAEISELTIQEFLTYVLQRVLEKFVDGVQFADDCHSIRELASRTLIEVCKDLMPEKNFEEEFEAGQKVYDSDDCLTLGAFVIRYYLNGETTIQDTTPDSEMNLTTMLNTAANWALDRYGCLFGYDLTKHPNDSVWQKAYDTVFALLPLNIFVGATPVSVAGKQLYMPGVADSASGLENLILNDILGGVLEFNIEEGALEDVGVTGLNKILSLIGRRDDSELNKPIPQFLMDLVARLINPLFGLPTEKAATDQLALIIPYTYTSLDQLVTAKHNTDTLSLTNTLYRLCKNIPFINKGNGSLFYKASPIIAKLIGLWGTDDGDIRYPFIDESIPSDFNDGKQYSYEQLKALYEQYADTNNEGIEYDDDAYSYFRMVDFKPFLYLDFKSARSDVGSLVSDYETGKADMETFRADATSAAYKLLTTVRFMNEGFNYDKSIEADENNYEVYGETAANDNQLIKVINKAAALGVEQEEYEDGTKKYTDRSWTLYSRAKAFADKVEAEYQAAATAVDSAKALRDMRQSRINEARKRLVDAMAALKSWVPLADYTGLDADIENIAYNVSLRQFSEKAIQKVIDAYLEAINLDRDYDMDDQFVVDVAQEKLAEAMADMEGSLIDFMMLWADGSEQFIDEDNSYLFGLPEGFANEVELEENGGFDSYMAMFAAGFTGEWEQLMLGIDSTYAGNGTGSVIKMYSYEDEAMENPSKTDYTVIVFGDVDGDAYSNGCDSIVLKAYNKGLLTNAQFGKAALYAADANESGTIDTKDATFYETTGLMKTFTNQMPESLIYKTYGILDRLGLRETA